MMAGCNGRGGRRWPDIAGVSNLSGRRPLVALLMLLFMLPSAMAQVSMTPAYLDHFDAQKRKVVLRNGVSLAYLDLGARDDRPVILIHGYTDSARDWAPIARLLTPHLRLIIIDLRGHGISAKPDCCYTRFDFAEDVKLLMDSLHIASADVVGHSLGSIVAQTFAELWPDAIRRLVLISSTGTSFGATESPAACASNRPTVAGWLASVEQLNDPIDPESSFMRGWWAESIRVNPAYFSRRQRRDAAAIPAHIWRAVADQTLVGVDLRYMLPRIYASTLLIWGELDALADDTGREALRAGIAHAEVRTFAAVGHDLFWEDPSAVAATLIDFLAGG